MIRRPKDAPPKAPADTPAAFRSRERYRRIAWSTGAGVTARLVGTATSFISVPLLVTYLGDESYGMWLTLTSLVALLAPLDLGVGNGVTNLIAESQGRNDPHRARQFVSSAFVVLFGVAVTGGIVLTVLDTWVPWPAVFNVDSPQAAQDARSASLTYLALFLIGLPMSLIGRIQLGLQSEYLSSIWLAAGNVAALVGILVGIQLGIGLPGLILMLVGIPLLAALGNGYLLFSRRAPWLAPDIRLFRWPAAKHVLRRGSLFVVLQLAGAIGYQSDNVVIAQVLGAEWVPEYAIPLKLFSVGPLLLSFALTPMWPAYAEAIARGDGQWVRSAFRRSVALAMTINVPTALFFLAVGPTILELWVGEAVSPTPLLLVGLAIWTLLNSLNGPLAMLLLGANVVGFQVATALLMATFNVAISIWLVREIGVAGAIYGSIVAQAAFITLPTLAYSRRLLRRFS